MPVEITEIGIKLPLGNGPELPMSTDKNDTTNAQLDEQQLKAEIEATANREIKKLDNSSEHR